MSEPPPAPRRSPRGFTLIELMIVVGIMGILVAIAYPSYGRYVMQTKRTDAQFALLDARQALERCRSTTYTYTGCSLAAHATSPDGNYAIAFDGAPTASTFRLEATATGTQANDTACATMTVDHLEATAPAECWD